MNEEILVSAAASLTGAFQAIGRVFEQANPPLKVRFNFGASGALERQIEQGAPVDVFASAGDAEMNALAKAGRINPTTRSIFAGNKLALVVPTGGRLDRMEVTKPPGWYTLSDPFVRRIALSNPETVPSGRYARQLLERQGIWPRVRAKAVFGGNVRQTLTYVTTGDVDAGIVFVTDARAAKGRVRVLVTSLAPRDHDPIVYPAAVLTDAPNADVGRRFVAFLRSAPAQAVLKKQGFLPAPPPARR